MEAPRAPAIAATLGTVIVLLLAGLPAQADMHTACDTQRPEAEGAAGPAAYANVYLARDPVDGDFGYGGAVYCPGAVVTIESVAVTTTGPYGNEVEVASTSAQACTSDPATVCSANDTVGSLEVGTYDVRMVYDADDPNTDGLEYNDTVRRQEFTWLGAGQPVVTCPDVGWVHANPPECVGY